MEERDPKCNRLKPLASTLETLDLYSMHCIKKGTIARISFKKGPHDAYGKKNNKETPSGKMKKIKLCYIFAMKNRTEGCDNIMTHYLLFRIQQMNQKNECSDMH